MAERIEWIVEILADWIRRIPGNENWCMVCGAPCDLEHHDRDMKRVKWRFFLGMWLRDLTQAVETDAALHSIAGEGPCITCGATEPDYDHAEDCDLATGLFKITWYERRHGGTICADCGCPLRIGETYCMKPIEGDDTEYPIIGGIVVCSGCAVLA